LCVRISNPPAGSTAWTYDGNGNMLTQTSSLGELSWAYDADIVRLLARRVTAALVDAAIIGPVELVTLQLVGG
jgi:YD repeat-containing protein